MGHLLFIVREGKEERGDQRGTDAIYKEGGTVKIGEKGGEGRGRREERRRELRGGELKCYIRRHLE